MQTYCNIFFGILLCALSLSASAAPSCSISATRDTICAGQSTTLHCTASPNCTYLWSTGATGPGLNVSPMFNTTYAVTVTDNSSATASASVLITVRLLPHISAGRDTSVCAGDSLVLHATGGLTYSWYLPGQPNNIFAQNITVRPLVSSLYIVEGSYTATIGCSVRDTVLVSVDTLPTVNAGRDTTICLGNSVVLYTASPGVSYQWSGNYNGPSIMVKPLINTDYALTITNGRGCKNTDHVNVNVYALPDYPLLLDSEASLCSMTRGAYFRIRGQNKVRYDWYFNPEIFSYGDEVSRSLNLPLMTVSSLIIAVVARDSNTGCSVTLNKVVPILPYTAPAPPVVVLHGTTGELICLNNTAKSYQWGYDDNSGVAVTIAGQTLQSCTIPLSLDTLHRHYWAMITDAQGCTTKGYYNLPYYSGFFQQYLLNPNDIHIFPNPNHGLIEIELPESFEPHLSQIKVFDPSGRYCHSYDYHHSLALDLNDGMYILEGKSERNETIFKKQISVIK